ncbi:glycerate kinase [Curtobacterium sp. MCJR17_055]|uniref:glycerate kinase n=1 Tax=unclassified Curtobacterium TaxID=257496 RepID=UPI000D888AF6|nr:MULTISPECIES: glycerate kinase [unclassified Curtobacterium]PYY32033.1 glycerate kinase [Curtobacterium sp. MCBD17_029]PYY58779.1 glycerate kinase [Curtobacterium sp. MCJR17_055]PYY59680.1 glycerate kinase [Curtobacterium sp. MCPF17_015]
MRVVIAPDSFKGTASAADIAAAVAEGWRTERPDDELVVLPMADGGEGTLDAFAAAVPGSERVPVRVTGPDDRPVESSWLRLPDGRAVVELAATSGLGLLDEPEPDSAHTTGFGQAVAAALDAGATGLLLGIGGSASTDGGVGALRALGLGIALDDSADASSATGGTLLDHVAAVDRTSLRPLPPRGVTVLSDVTSPLLGPEGAAAVFGPQKGVTPDRVPVHETRLARWAAHFPDVDPATPGAGAAGGTGFGLLAWGARVGSGAGAVAEALGLADAVAAADLVVTGEGRFDGQTAAGKTPTVVTAIAVAAGTPVALVAGDVAARLDAFSIAASLTVIATQTTGEPDDALRDPLRFARVAGERMARAQG